MSCIKVECEDCKKVHQVCAQDIQFDQVDLNERQLGEEITYEGCVGIHCVCGNNIEVNHLFWEYPEGVEDHCKTNVYGGVAVENTL